METTTTMIPQNAPTWAIKSAAPVIAPESDVPNSDIVTTHVSDYMTVIISYSLCLKLYLHRALLVNQVLQTSNIIPLCQYHTSRHLLKV